MNVLLHGYFFWKKRSADKHNRADIRIFPGKMTYAHARRRQFMPHRFQHECSRIQTKKGVQKRFCTPCILWSGREDSNFRPLAPHASALPGCATPRTDEHYISLSANVAYFHFILVNQDHIIRHTYRHPRLFHTSLLQGIHELQRFRRPEIA